MANYEKGRLMARIVMAYSIIQSSIRSDAVFPSGTVPPSDMAPPKNMLPYQVKWTYQHVISDHFYSIVLFHWGSQSECFEIKQCVWLLTFMLTSSLGFGLHSSTINIIRQESMSSDLFPFSKMSSKVCIFMRKSIEIYLFMYLFEVWMSSCQIEL